MGGLGSPYGQPGHHSPNGGGSMSSKRTTNRSEWESRCLWLSVLPFRSANYLGFAAAWPQSKDEGADYFNSVRKYVVSRTLEEPLEWNNSTLIKDNIMEEITNLKQKDGKDIAVHGSATLVQMLMQHDLVDRYRLLVYPVVLGKGKRLFKEA